jgi:hypothetical protein
MPQDGPAFDQPGGSSDVLTGFRQEQHPVRRDAYLATRTTVDKHTP